MQPPFAFTLRNSRRCLYLHSKKVPVGWGLWESMLLMVGCFELIKPLIV